MKKALALMVSFMLFFSWMTAGAGFAENRPVQVVVTIFPIYDWVREIAGDGASSVEITMLLDSGVDLHSYQPTARDILSISRADLFIYVGGESDEWVEDVLASAANPNLRTVNLMEVLGENLKAEQIVEGMEHDHDEEEDQENGHGHEEEMDEHVWLSLRNAQKLVSVIAGMLSQADPMHAENYANNAAAYSEKLADLDQQYVAATEAAANKTLLFGDRFPFRYLTEDYGLDYYAAFAGCSAETEASFETIAFLAQKVDDLGLKSVLKVDNTDGRIAETVVQTTKSKDQRIISMNSMQAITARDVENSASYLTIMEENLEALKEALR